jgi:hypothetical protein
VNKWDEAGDAVRSVIRAYHGSPHEFDRFDASKIGTGEGAQAYGHGLYFAGSEDTADFYRRKLSEDGDAPERWARDFWDAQSKPDAIGSPEKAYDYLLGYIRSIRNAGPGSAYSPGLKSHYAAAEKYLLSQDPRAVPAPIRQGHMYEVEIAHPERSLLDWDVPFARQEPRVMRAAERAGVYGRKWPRQELSVGESIALRGDEFGRGELAENLFSAGVPGIKYLDGMSRRAGEGTRNYVMFPGTEDSIRILRKYAIPGAVGTGAASQYEEER